MREELGQLIRGIRRSIKVAKQGYRVAKWLWWGLSFLGSHVFLFLVLIGMVSVVSAQQEQQLVALQMVQNQSEVGGEALPIPPIEGELIFPLDNFRITCSFTCYSDHGGLDMSSQYGAEVRAVMNGTVIKVVTGYASDGGYIGHPGGYGNQVLVQHENGVQTRYAHLMDTIRVSVGDEVVIGQVIGQQGNSGNSSGSHLHFEWLENGIKVDPVTRLPFVIDTDSPSIGDK